MRSVGIKALKNDLSKHIRAVVAGETVIVTDRGKVVAEIVPPKKPTTGWETDEEILDRLERQGLVKRATGRGKPMPPRLPSVMPFEELMRDLDDSRSDR